MSFMSFVPFWNSLSDGVSQRVLKFILSQTLGKYLELESDIVFGATIELTGVRLKLQVSILLH